VTKEVQQTIDWGVNVVQAPMLWGTTKGEGLKVAILDTGIDRSHPDLVANLKGGANFSSSDRGDYEDRQGHGTHCAGIIGASDNGIGVVGVAPAVELYAVKVMGDNGSGGMQAIADGLDWCIANGIDIASMSLGTSGDPGPILHDAIKRARQAGIILVAASGNEHTHCGWPAAYDEVIAVGAVDAGFDKADFSNFGSEVDVAAPGVQIYSTYKNQSYAKLSGTSMATPMVAGCVAIIQSLCRKMGQKATPEIIMQMLTAKSVDLGADGKDTEYGAGLINLYKLLAHNNK
jgi:subtilisin